MAVNPPQLVNVNCPACGTRYTAPFQNIIDVGRDPRLKTLLLQGRINVGVCPSCGAAGMLGVPLTYHDPEKELLFCLVPQELHMSETERQRAIGEMSNAVIGTLTADQRKGYLLQPRVFLTFQTMIESVLEADGITKEMLQAQQEKLELIGSMAEVVDDALELAALIGPNEHLIDYEFFSLLSLQLTAAEQGSDTGAAAKLVRLRDALLARTETGREVAEQQQAVEEALSGIDENLTRQDLLERILNTGTEHQDQILQVLLALARPLIDYQFFQLLTARIEQSDSEHADRLRALREQILDITQELDAQVRAQTQQKAKLLGEILRSEAPRDTIRAHLDEIDDTFMAVLAASIAQNQESGPEVSQRLQAIQTVIVEVLQETAPPELRFISELMEAEYPDGTRELLSTNQGMVTPQLLGMMEAVANQIKDRGDDQATTKLQGIIAQAKLMG